ARKPLDSAVLLPPVYPNPSTENRKVTGLTPVGATRRRPALRCGFPHVRPQAAHPSKHPFFSQTFSQSNPGTTRDPRHAPLSGGVAGVSSCLSVQAFTITPVQQWSCVETSYVGDRDVSCG